ncbi:MAG TPA: hypothetical protein VFN11_02110 [Ktedonobacterales bacterium]|nr:hypothetical protein [Ktedonobacterales bacterium]
MMVTTNAGATWKRLQSSSQFIASVAMALAGGHIFGIVLPQDSDWRLAELSIHGGAWRMLDTTMPHGALFDSQIPVGVDPDDPATMYADVQLNNISSIIATHDGGVSWRVVQKLPGAQRVSIWTTHRHQVFVEQIVGQDVTYQMYYSKDSGATWHGIGLHYKGGGEPVYVGADGDIVVTRTAYSATSDNLFTLDPNTGVFTLLGTYPLPPGLTFGSVIEGATPALILGSMSDTFVLYLSTSKMP